MPSNIYGPNGAFGNLLANGGVPEAPLPISNSPFSTTAAPGTTQSGQDWVNWQNTNPGQPMPGSGTHISNGTNPLVLNPGPGATTAAPTGVGTGGPATTGWRPGGMYTMGNNPGGTPYTGQPGGTYGRPDGGQIGPPGTGTTGTNGPGSQLPGTNSGFGSTSQFQLSPELQQAFQFALQQAMGAYNPNAQYFNGQLTPNLTTDDLAAQNMLRTLSGGMVDRLAPFFDAQRTALNATNGGPNPMLDAAVNATTGDMTRAHTQVGGTLDRLRQQFVGAGQYGSMKQGVLENQANNEFAGTLGDTIARMRLADKGQTQQFATQMSAQTPSMLNSSALPAQLLSAVGGQNRELQGNLNSEDFSKWAFNLAQPNVALQNLLGSLGASLPLGGVSQTQTNQPDWYTQLMQQTMQQNLTNGSGGNTGGSGSSLLAGLLGAGSLWQLFK